MKASVKESINKVKQALIDNEYQTAKQLGDKCGLKPCSIYRVVKNMRIAGIGVLPSSCGYVLSQYAKKNDDVGFIRRVYGRRASDFIAVKAAQPDISRRWNSIEEKKELKLLIQPLFVNLSDSKGMNILLKKTNSKGL
jgi:hypothetical protein